MMLILGRETTDGARGELRKEILAGVAVALSTILIIYPGFCWGKAISGFQRSVGYHINVPAYQDYQIDDILRQASSLISDVEIISECGDPGACVALRKIAPVFSWGAATDYNNLVVREAQLDTLLRYGPERGINFKIVSQITINGTPFYGQSLDSLPSTVITEDAPAFVWAHEFGHTQGLPGNNSCRTLIMCEPDKTPPCALDQVELDPDPAKREVVGFESHPDDSTFGCNPKGESLLRYLTAVHETDGNHITFATLWEFDSDSFAVEKFDAQGVSAGIIGSVLAAGGSGGSGYSIVDAYGVAGDRYKLIERQIGTLPDLTIGTCTAQEPFTGFPIEPATYNTDSLAVAVMALAGC